MPRWQGHIAVLFGVCLGGLAAAVVASVIDAVSPPMRWLVGGCLAAGLAAFVLLVGIATPYVLIRRRALTHLRRRMVELGIQVCTRCGYDLRGSPGPRCPECGTPFDPPAADQRHSAT